MGPYGLVSRSEVPKGLETVMLSRHTCPTLLPMLLVNKAYAPFGAIVIPSGVCVCVCVCVW